MKHNIITYAQTVLEPFSVRPFSPVDSLILSSAVYICLPRELSAGHSWEGIPLRELFLAEHFEEMFHIPWMAEENRELLTAMVASPRFRDVKIRGYREQIDTVEQKQFAAMTFQLTPELCYVAFRGTDSTLVGWKEDFNMFFQCPVPAQKEAVSYLEEAVVNCPGAVLTGGHSKGGNLAIYAAAMCSEETRHRLGRVYSHDGPGFTEETLATEAFRRVEGIIERTLPQSSVVGLLLEQGANFRVVKSRNLSVFQHDQYSWVVKDGNFRDVKDLTHTAQYTDRALTNWLNGLSREERERFVDALYSVINANDMTTLAELRSDWAKHLPSILRAVNQLDSETKHFLGSTLKALVTWNIKTVPEMLQERKK